MALKAAYYGITNNFFGKRPFTDKVLDFSFLYGYLALNIEMYFFLFNSLRHQSNNDLLVEFLITFFSSQL